MDSLDNSSQPMSAPIWTTALTYGAYCGGVFVVSSLLMYLASVNLMSLSGVAILYGSIFAIGSTFAVLSIRHQRDHLDGGNISYGKALLVGLVTVFIGVVISGFWNYILINFIDPNYIAVMKEQFMDAWGENMPQEALEQAMEGFEKTGELGSTLKSSLFGGIFFGLIIGLITAAFLKKQPEISIR